ncbi:MAG UNVERIFIED_CONTAM: hypothetical protein LVT10_03050 [Anaerolineae bacterium]|jgi:hypothetical protein
MVGLGVWALLVNLAPRSILVLEGPEADREIELVPSHSHPQAETADELHPWSFEKAGVGSVRNRSNAFSTNFSRKSKVDWVNGYGKLFGVLR